MLSYILLISILVMKTHCIPQTSTTLKCGPNEVYNPCPKYCTFDTTCIQILYGIIKTCGPPPANYPCYPRCECKPGLVRIGLNCVPPANCCTKNNEVLVPCPAVCDNTCMYSYLPGTCYITPCNKYACKCKQGYIRDLLTGHCVLYKDCVY